MRRVLFAIALIASAAVSHAQQPQPLPQPIPRPVPLPAPTLPGAGAYVYTAQTAATVRRSGAVTAGTLTWTCSGVRCTIRGPWPQPGVAACAALAREVGRIVSYGRQGAMLTPAQITQCNAAVAPPQQQPQTPSPSSPEPAGVSITTTTLRAEGAPEAGAPAPFASVAITTTTLRAEGSPDAGAPAPFTPVDITTTTLRAEGAPQ